jgi:hypothetical protein
MEGPAYDSTNADGQGSSGVRAAAYDPVGAVSAKGPDARLFAQGTSTHGRLVEGPS